MFSSLKNMIFEEDPAAVAKQPPKAVSPTTGTPTTGTPSIGSTGSSLNPAFVEAIKKSVFSRNTALTQLMHAADKLTNIIPDVPTRFKAAFATVGDGRTVRQIIEAADIHLADVEGEELKFKSTLDQKIQTAVGGLEAQAAATAQQVKNAQAEIEQAQKRIADLSASINDLMSRQHTLTAEAQSKRAELDLAGMQFKAAADAVRHELQTTKSVVSSALS